MSRSIDCRETEGRDITHHEKKLINNWWTLHHGDCLDVLKAIPDGSIDLVLADPPYGTTQCKWDSVISMVPLWEQLNRIIKPDTAVVMTACQPFTSALIMSNPKDFRYCWVWEKTAATGHLNANRMPLRAHEDIVVFSKRQARYIPQKTSGHERKTATQGVFSPIYGKQRATSYDSTDRHPRSVINISTVRNNLRLHPTQKPVALMEYMIKTYTYEGQTVLDFTMGSGTTGVACQNTGRSFIGIEKDADYFQIAKNRIEASAKQLSLAI